MAVINSINTDKTIDYSKLNDNLPEGFKEENGLYIKGNNKYVVNVNGEVYNLLPYEYLECEYLQSTGDQYINTGYIPTDNTNINIEYELPSWFNHNQNYSLLGSNSLSIKFFRFSGGLTTTFNKGKNKTDIYKWGFNYGDIYKMSILGNQIKLINSQGTYTNTVDVDFTDIQSLPIFLWAINEENSANEKISGKIYSFTIFENSIITAYFVPALDQNNRPCMFNSISRQAFYNQGSGEFSYELK